MLTWSADHHQAQPAHASLRFGGGRNPDRGAVLRTSATAPLTRARFESGYTIETFIKLPDPFEGDHAFMGILSWEGRSGDAGKTSGWSPDEPTCSLNLSGERFLQFVVYPVDRDADPTSWSHALPVGRWTHVAVVNDGRRTVTYVDGSRIARNADEDSRGITTLGKRSHRRHPVRGGVRPGLLRLDRRHPHRGRRAAPRPVPHRRALGACPGSGR